MTSSFFLQKRMTHCIWVSFLSTQPKVSQSVHNAKCEYHDCMHALILSQPLNVVQILCIKFKLGMYMYTSIHVHMYIETVVDGSTYRAVYFLWHYWGVQTVHANSTARTKWDWDIYILLEPYSFNLYSVPCMVIVWPNFSDDFNQQHNNATCDNNYYNYIPSLPFRNYLPPTWDTVAGTWPHQQEPQANSIHAWEGN